MRLIGISCAWGCEDWAEYYLLNALKYVDELWVTVSYGHPNFKAIEDRTDEIVREMANKHPNLHYFKSKNVDDPKANFEVGRCMLLRAMMDASKPQKDDVIMIVDSDELYDHEGRGKIRDFVRDTRYNLGLVNGLNFCIDTNHYVVSPNMERLFRITEPRWSFIPTQKPVPRPKDEKLICNMYHYQMLINPAYKRLHWPLSQTYDPKLPALKKRWFEEIYMNWQMDNESHWKKKNEELCGNYGFWHNKDFVEKEGGGLIEFTGYHPESIHLSHLICVPDFRTAYPIIEEKYHRDMPSLIMVHPNEKKDIGIVPSEYIVRKFEWDRDSLSEYVGLMHSAGFAKWGEGTAAGYIRANGVIGLFVVEHLPTKKLVASALASLKHGNGMTIGELGWVAGDTNHRGKGIGRMVCRAAVNGMIEEGASQVFLRTDDFRIQAIKTYFNMGFVPVITSENVQKRWDKLISILKTSNVTIQPDEGMNDMLKVLAGN